MSDAELAANDGPIITEELLRGVDDLVVRVSEGRWDLPPGLFVFTSTNKLGLVALNNEVLDAYPDPTDAFNHVAQWQRDMTAQMKESGTVELDYVAQRVAAGEPVAIIAVVESWGMDGPEYEAALRAMPPKRLAMLMQQHGYVPIPELPGAKEQRNILAIDRDLKATSLTRYRDTGELEYESENDAHIIASGRLNHALVSCLGAFRECWEYEKGMISGGPSGT